MDIIQHIATIKNMPLNAPAPAGGLGQYVPFQPVSSASKSDDADYADATPYYYMKPRHHMDTPLSLVLSSTLPLGFRNNK